MQYTINTRDERKRVYVRRYDDTLGRDTTIPITIARRIVDLRDCGTGAVVATFTAYLHQGRMRYRDSRDKKASDSPNEVLDEITRMTGITRTEATALLEA